MIELEDDEWLEAVGDYMICDLECQQALEKLTKDTPWQDELKYVIEGALLAGGVGSVGVLMMIVMAYMFTHS